MAIPEIPVTDTKAAPCQAAECLNPATWTTHASNERRPDMGSTQVCDDHLAEPGLCQASGLPDPDSWTVVPIHEGSPPYCLASCPTCHPARSVMSADMQRELSDAALTLHDARVPLVKDGRRLSLAERIRDLIDAGRYAGNAARIEKETADRAFASLKEIGTHIGHIAGETTLSESVGRLAVHARILEDTLNEALNRHWHLVNRRTPVTDGEHAASNEWIRRSSLVLDRNRSPSGTPIGIRHAQAAVDLAHNRVRCMAAGAGGRPCRWEGPISAVKGFGGDGRPECPRCGQDQLVEVLPSDFAKLANHPALQEAITASVKGTIARPPSPLRNILRQAPASPTSDLVRVGVESASPPGEWRYRCPMCEERQAIATGTAEVVCYACSTRVALVWPQMRPGWDEAAKAGRAFVTASSSFADLLQAPAVRTALAGVTIGEVFRSAVVAYHLTKDLPAPSGGDKAEDREIPPADLFGRGISMLRRLADEASDLGAVKMADQLDDLRSRLWPEEVDDDAER